MRVPAEVIQVAMDDALKKANPFYEGLAKPYIPQLDQLIEEALVTEGYSIVVTKELERLLDVDRKAKADASVNTPGVAQPSVPTPPPANFKVGG